MTQHIMLLILEQNWVMHIVDTSHTNTQGSKKVDMHCGAWSVICWADCTVHVSLISKQAYSRNQIFSMKGCSKLGTWRHQTKTESRWPTGPLPPPAEVQGTRTRGMKRREQLRSRSRFPAEVKDWRPWGAECFTCMSMIRYLYLKKNQTKQNKNLIHHTEVDKHKRKRKHKQFSTDIHTQWWSVYRPLGYQGLSKAPRTNYQEWMSFSPYTSFVFSLNIPLWSLYRAK